MLSLVFTFPPEFWVVVGLLGVGAVWATGQIRTAIGLPMIAVLGTVGVWYPGDALYNDYNGYRQDFPSITLSNAWWEVAWFVTVFLALTPIIHRWLNARYLQGGSQVLRMLQTGSSGSLFQLRLNELFWACGAVWMALVVLAALRVGNELPYYFFPFLGVSADPWGRGRIGGGIDALLSLASYVQVFVAAIFGIVAALARNWSVRGLAFAGCMLTWPYYLFGWARNAMLAVTVPAILAWVFLRLRGGKLQKVIFLTAAFLLVNAWFSFVIANRSTMSLASALETKGFSLANEEKVHNEGLNMFEELCWINALIKDGTYEPKWGQEYFAELVNPIPRSVWPGKPFIGIDYSIARGMAGQSEGNDAGVVATISSGMIGQGVLNFGRIMGPAFAALLMGFWAAALARLDLQGQKVGRIPLFALGMILTFNLGRDISLITLYTFVFGSAIVWWLEWRERSGHWTPVQRRGKRTASPKSGNDRKNQMAVAEASSFPVTSAEAAEMDRSSKRQD